MDESITYTSMFISLLPQCLFYNFPSFICTLKPSFCQGIIFLFLDSLLSLFLILLVHLLDFLVFDIFIFRIERGQIGLFELNRGHFHLLHLPTQAFLLVLRCRLIIFSPNPVSPTCYSGRASWRAARRL